MTDPIPPVTPAHAGGITATEQDATTAAVEAAAKAIMAYDWEHGLSVNGTVGDHQRAEARAAVAAAAPIIAADERERIALAIEAEGRRRRELYGTTASNIIDYREAAAVARAGTSEADR